LLTILLGAIAARFVFPHLSIWAGDSCHRARSNRRRPRAGDCKQPSHPGLIYLRQEIDLPGEPTIQLAVIGTVLLSIFAHGLSAAPGIGLYVRKIALLDSTAPELRCSNK
jgi:hypothetical protein